MGQMNAHSLLNPFDNVKIQILEVKGLEVEVSEFSNSRGIGSSFVVELQRKFKRHHAQLILSAEDNSVTLPVSIQKQRTI